MGIEYKITRLEARVIPKLDGRENVVRDLVVGMTGVNEDGLTAYRDTLVRVPDPTDEDWVAFTDIDEARCAAHAEKAAEDNKWKDSIKKEIEAAKTKPLAKLFSFQQEAARIASENLRAAEREKIQQQQASGPNGE